MMGLSLLMWKNSICGVEKKNACFWPQSHPFIVYISLVNKKFQSNLKIKSGGGKTSMQFLIGYCIVRSYASRQWQTVFAKAL